MLANGIRDLSKVISRASRGLQRGWSVVRNELFIIIAWGLVTWGVFQFNSRAWAISVGLYLALNAVLAILAGAKNVRNSV